MDRLVDGKYSFQDLVDIDQLKEMFEEFSEATGFTTGLSTYPEHQFLFKTGWRKACSDFHRKFKSSDKNCDESNFDLISNLVNKRNIHICHCKNGLIDGATPIIVEGVHIASLATGQVFFGKPDLDKFKKQAELHGYNIEEYIQAIKETPVVSKEKFTKALLFLRDIAVMLAEQALLRLRIQKINVEIKDQKEYSKTLFQDSKIPIALIDAESQKITDCNMAAVLIYGYSKKSEIIGKTPVKLSAPVQYNGLNSSELVKIFASKALKSGYEIFEWKHERASGEIWDAEVHLTRILINGKNHLLYSLIEITERKRIKREKKLLEKQLNHFRKMDAISQLAGGVAHDFNNMLMGIMGAAQSLKLKKRNLDDQSLKLVDIILNAAERSADLTSKLLVFGRKNNDIDVETDIHRIIDESIGITSKSINKKIKVTSIKDAEKSVIKGNTTDLQSAVINLIINSSHAMPCGGLLSIETNNIYLDRKYTDLSPFDIDPGNYIEIQLRDTGCGIEPQNIERIFDPFFTTKEEGKGSGLGLAAVYGTVQKHRGAVTVYSTKDIGTVFCIYLPVIEEKSSRQNENLQKIIRGTGKILLVDDEEIIRTTGSYILEEAGYNVITAVNGQDALKIFEQNSDIDLVIIDMIMPKMDGTNTFYNLKKTDPDCLVILSSGFTKEENLCELKDDGLAGFIKKPFKKEELTSLISTLLVER